MNTLKPHILLILAGMLFLSSTIIIVVNQYFLGYTGNNYFPENTPIVTILLFLIYSGLNLQFGTNHPYTYSGRQLVYFFCLFSLIAYATNAIQLTPFRPIDQQILELEQDFFVNYQSILDWINNYPQCKKILNAIYASLPYQMVLIPIFIISMKQNNLLNEYYFLMLFTALIGFSVYYFFPTTAPASLIKSTLFSDEQRATGFKFYQIHNHMHPTTNEGGLIALPSFHTIWALINVYLLKDWPIFFVLLGIINMLLILSCVLLGWHYIIDILGAIVLFGFSLYFLRSKANYYHNPVLC